MITNNFLRKERRKKHQEHKTQLYDNQSLAILGLTLRTLREALY